MAYEDGIGQHVELRLKVWEMEKENQLRLKQDRLQESLLERAKLGTASSGIYMTDVDLQLVSGDEQQDEIAC